MIANLTALAIRLFTGVRQMQSDDLKLPRKVFFARHQSHFDTLIIWAALPQGERQKLRPVAALDYWGKTRLRRWFACSVLRALLIDRNPKCSRTEHPLAPMRKALDAGDSLLIFPEGKRETAVNVGDFKSGIYHLARHQERINFLPVHLENLGRILPRGEMLPLPVIARLELHPALSLRDHETRISFLTRCREAAL